MSGGFFDYSEYQLSDIADSIEHVMQDPSADVFDDCTAEEKTQVLRYMKQIMDDARIVRQQIHALDYFLSDDYGAMTFLAEMRRIEANKDNDK